MMLRRGVNDVALCASDVVPDGTNDVALTRKFMEDFRRGENQHKSFIIRYSFS